VYLSVFLMKAIDLGGYAMQKSLDYLDPVDRWSTTRTQ